MFPTSTLPEIYGYETHATLYWCKIKNPILI